MSNNLTSNNVTSLQYDIVILGQHHEAELHYLRYILDKIKNRKDQTAKFEFIVEFETQFNENFNELLKKNKEFIDLKGQSPIIYLRDLTKIIGNFNSFISFIVENFSLIEEKNISEFQDQAILSYKSLLNNQKNQYAFLEINDFVKPVENDYNQFKDQTSRTVIIELFSQICPKTVMNFLEICKGTQKNKKGEKLTYKGCEIFRVVKNGYLQSGDLSQLSGTKSIYGENFEDENFTIKHDVPGIIGSVKNRQKIHTNESQFYITLNPLQYFDGKFVAFGRVIKGFELIKRIAEVSCYLQRPKEKIEIINCGTYNG